MILCDCSAGRQVVSTVILGGFNKTAESNVEL